MVTIGGEQSNHCRATAAAALINDCDYGQPNNAKYLSSDLNLTNRLPNILVKRNTKIQNKNSKSHYEHEFRPTVQFPIIRNQLLPDIRPHIGSPEKFLYIGFGIKASTEIQFNRNI